MRLPTVLRCFPIWHSLLDELRSSQWRIVSSPPSARVTMSGLYVLLQFGENPFSTRFEDLEARAAFTVYVFVFVLAQRLTSLFRRKARLIHSCRGPIAHQPISWHKQVDADYQPNLVIQITRESQWSQQHPSIMGPDKSFFYFGPQTQAGYVVYGNGPSIAMKSLIRQKKDGSTYVLSPSFVLCFHPRCSRFPY